jgi:hypothetical protein
MGKKEKAKKSERLIDTDPASAGIFLSGKRGFAAGKTPQFVDQFAVGAAIGGADSHIDTALEAGTFNPTSATGGVRKS